MSDLRAALVERVSEGLKAELSKKAYTDEYDGVLLHDGEINMPTLALAAIRAVLLGVREPGEGMVEAACNAGPDYRAEFAAMIDALLAEVG